MNTLQKIGLTIGAFAIATLPFFIKEKSKDETLVDILCRDIYENTAEYSRGVKSYALKDRKVSVVGFSDIAVEELEGMALKDLTPETIAGERVVGCRIVDQQDASQNNFSPEELKELEYLAKTNIKYRTMEREIFRDVKDNGKVLSRTSRTINFPVLKNIPIIQSLLTFSYPIVMEQSYSINDGKSAAVVINCENGTITHYRIFENPQNNNEYTEYERYGYNAKYYRARSEATRERRILPYGEDNPIDEAPEEIVEQINETVKRD